MKPRTRREFLSEMLPAAVAVGAGLAFLEPQLPAASQLSRTYTAGRFGLEVGGVFAGWVESAAGGQAVLEGGAAGPKQIQNKYIPGVKYEDVTINCGTGMSRDFYEWIKASLEKQFVRKNCAVVSCDFNYKVRSRMECVNALLTEVAFPACDAASKDAAKMTIRFAPESTRMTSGNAGAEYQPVRTSQMVQKKWLPSNFRLKIDGLDCAQVKKIAAVTAKLASSANPVGAARLGSGAATLPSVSNLVVSAPESRELYQWYEDSVVRGNASRTKAKEGLLDYLSPDLRDSIFSLSFRNLGILKLVPAPMPAGSVSARMVTAEMFCSDVGFSYGPAALA